MGTDRLTIDEAAEKLRGPANTLRLTLGLGSGGIVEDFQVLRDWLEFRVESGDVGYIRIPQFIASTTTS